MATLLSANPLDEVVQLRQAGAQACQVRYDAAVVSTELPGNTRADVVITLPDTRGGAGTGIVTNGTVIHAVSITTPEQVIELLQQYAPRSPDDAHTG